MTDHDAFLEAICERPDDDTPRLIYADWLDESGDVERAEFIRVQCEFHATRCGYAKDTDDAYSLFCNNTLCHHCNLDRRADQLLSTHGALWANSVVSAAPLVYPLSWQWSRGFISRITLPHDAFLEHAAALFCAAPIEAVMLSDKSPLAVGGGFAWYRHLLIGQEGADDLAKAIWEGLTRMLLADSVRKWCDTVEAANADLSNACVKLGRKRAAERRKSLKVT